MLEAERGPVALGLGEVLAVLEGLAPRDSAAVGLALTVLLALRVEVGEGGSVPEPVEEREGVVEGDAPGERVGVGDRGGLGEAETVLVPVPVPVALGLREVEALFEGLAPCEREAVGLALTVLLALRVDEGVDTGVSAAVEDREEDTDEEAPGERVDVGVEGGEEDAESVLHAVPVPVELLLSETDAEVEGLAP